MTTSQLSFYNELGEYEQEGVFQDLLSAEEAPNQKGLSFKPYTSVPDWWYNLCSSVFKPDTPVDYGLSEVLVEKSQVIFEFDLQLYDVDDDIDYVWDGIEKELVKTAQKLVSRQYELGDAGIDCIVLRSENPFSDPRIPEAMTFKYRLQFPNLILELQSILKLKTQLASDLDDNAEISSLIENIVENSWENTLRDSLNKNLVPLYGASRPDEEPVTFSAFYGEVTDNRVDVQDLVILHPKITEKTTGRIHNAFSDPEDALLFKGDNIVFFWLPLILSTQYDMAICQPKVQKREAPARASAPGAIPDEYCDDKVLLKYFMSVLNPERFRERGSWRAIGIAIKRAYKGSRDGLILFKEVTKHHGGFNHTECELWYAKLHFQSGIDYQTVAWFAREDNLDKYEEWHYEWVGVLLKRLIMHKNIQYANLSAGELFYRIFWLDHACSNLGHLQMWYFTGQRWVEQDNQHLLKQDLTKTMRFYLLKRKNDYNKQALNATNTNIREEYYNLEKRVNNLYDALESSAFRQNIVKDSALHFKLAHEKFLTLMDQNPNLYSCGNCVIESILSTGECTPRPGKPQDYMTKGTDVNYRSDFTEETPVVQKYIQYHEQTFPLPGLCNVIRKLGAGELLGRNYDKIVVLAEGFDGNNSKTTKNTLDKYVHGSYQEDIPGDYFYASANPLGPTPYIKAALHCRKVPISEVSGVVPYSTSRVKKYSGIDPIYTRNMRDNGGTGIPHFVNWFTGNVHPIFDSPDSSIRERSLFIPFVTNYVKSGAPKTLEEQRRTNTYPIDPQFGENLCDLAEAGLWDRVNYFAIYAKERFVDLPQCCLDASDDYWNEYDPYAKYRNRMLTKDPIGELDVSNIYLKFKEWFSLYYPSFPTPILNTFQQAMSVDLGKPSKFGIWSGWSANYSKEEDGYDSDFEH